MLDSSLLPLPIDEEIPPSFLSGLLLVVVDPSMFTLLSSLLSSPVEEKIVFQPFPPLLLSKLESFTLTVLFPVLFSPIIDDIPPAVPLLYTNCKTCLQNHSS